MDSALKQQIIHLTNLCFGYDRRDSTSYDQDFGPLFFEETHWETTFEGPQLTSCGALFPTTLFLQSKEYRLGIIGGVATHLAFRRKGYSKRILDQLIHHAQQTKLDGLVLWSDQRGFYEKLGFTAYGSQELWILEPGSELLSSCQAGVEQQVGESWKDWPIDKVRPLYERKSPRCLRRSSHWHWIAHVSSQRRYHQFVDSSGQERSAYMAWDRGKDMKRVIHEWGGDPQALLALLSQVLREENEPLFWLTNPYLDDPLRPILVSSGQQQEVMPLGYAMSLSSELPVHKLEKVWFWGFDSM